MQSTATSVLCADGVGPGVTVHDEPFHCSRSGEGPAPCCPAPTQKDALTQETPKNRPVVTVGVLPTVQFDALTVAGGAVAPAPPSTAVAPASDPPIARIATSAVDRAKARIRSSSDAKWGPFPSRH